ncbi:response regulator [Candidatus Pacebacteria bacterium]|nr:response regulator [Candidatus Paceibacterota bacterium]
MKKILLVEDDVFLRDLASIKLERAGFEMVTATTIDSALQKFHECQPDLIILDIELNGEQGTEVLENVKKVKPDFPVVVFSNKDDENIKTLCMNLGAAHFFLKYETDFTQLVEKVNELLG